METGSYAPETPYEVMLGEKSRDIKLTDLLAEGEDYEHVSFSGSMPRLHNRHQLLISNPLTFPGASSTHRR